VDGKISLARLDRSSGAVYGQGSSDAADGQAPAVSRGEPGLGSVQSAGPGRRSLSSLADSQERILDAFWQDSQDVRSSAPSAPPVAQRGLLESLQVAAAALNSEREDIVASQKLAERFAREPTRVSWQPPARRPTPPIRPYIVAAAFMIAITGGLAVYFLKSGGGPKRAPDGLPHAAAIAPTAEEPLDSLDERDVPPSRSFISSQPAAGQRAFAEPDSGQAAPPSRAFVSSQPAAGLRALPEPDSGQAAPPSRSFITSQPVPGQRASIEPDAGQAMPAPEGAAPQNWSSAVETLRQLAGAKNSSQQTKAGPPDKAQQVLQQLEAWRKTSKPQ
jgi:hypothetical protein